MSELANTMGKKSLSQYWSYFYLTAIVLAIYFTGASLTTYILLAATAALFIFPKPELGLSLIIFLTMIFERFFTLQSITFNLENYKIYPLDIVIFITALAWLIHVRLHKIKTKWFFHWPEIWVTLYIFIVSVIFGMSFFNLNADLSIAFSTFKNYAFYPLIYFFIIYSVQNKQQLKFVVHNIILAGLAILVFIGIGIIAGQGLWTEYTPLSTPGIRILAGTHAYYLMLGSMLLLPLIFFNRFWHQFPGLALFYLWLIGILGSLMRHLWLALFLGIVFFFFTFPKEARKKLLHFSLKNAVIGIFIVFAIIFLVNLFPPQNNSNQFFTMASGLENRILSLADTANDTSASWRLSLWRSAQKAWITSPWLGIGFGQKIPLETADWNNFEEVRNLHNSPLAILVQMGIVGAIIFMMIIASILFSSYKKIIKNKDLKPYYLGLMGGILVILFASLFQPYLETNMMGIFLWIFLGLLRTSQIIKDY